MSVLGDMQRKFTEAEGLLITYAFSQGYELSSGDAYRDPRLHGKFGDKLGYGSAYSLHKLRLAKDFNLFVNKKWIQTSEHPAWDDLHNFWESLGGAKRIRGDANHFSFQYGNYR